MTRGSGFGSGGGDTSALSARVDDIETLVDPGAEFTGNLGKFKGFTDLNVNYGIPSSGTYAVGDFVIARHSGWDYVWIWMCHTAGSPGSWTNKISPLSDATPEALGSASAGDDSLPARADHVHPTTGLVLAATLDANTILYATTDNTPAALTVAASRLVGRAASGDIDDLTLDQVQALLDARTATLSAVSNEYEPNADTTGLAIILDPAANFTVKAPTGTPRQGQKLEIWIRSDATGRVPTWNAIYQDSGIAAKPTTQLPASKWVSFVFRYNLTITKWVCFAADNGGY